MTEESDVDLLSDVPIFQLLSHEERHSLAKRLEPVSLPKGTLIFSTGDPGDSLYIIRSGEVEVFFKDDTGVRVLLETNGKGDFFGEISLLDNGPRTASVVVTEDLDALRMDHDDLEEFLRGDPGAAMELLAACGRRLRKTSELLRHTASRNVNEEVDDQRTWIQRWADAVAAWSGSIPFLLIHCVIFAVWIVWNTTPALHAFDPYPFGLLTMSVSLEAIVLSVLLLLSQNRQSAKDRVRSDIEYQVNLKAELEVAHLHEKMDRLTEDSLARFDGLERRLDGRAEGTRTFSGRQAPAK